jgi:hypothetical protein
MIVGIISDTHDNIDKLREACTLFEEYGVELVLHGGDHNRQDIYDEMGFPMISVLGNHDDPYRFEDYTNARGFKIEFHEGTYEFSLDGKEIAICHGDLPYKIIPLVNCQKYDLVITGHNHIPGLKQNGKTLRINPGHFKVPVKGDYPDYKLATIALYDTLTGEAWFEPLV